MKNNLKYLIIGFGMITKSWWPQEAQCPTSSNVIYKNYLKIEKELNYPNTINVKKVANFYNLCGED